MSSKNKPLFGKRGGISKEGRKVSKQVASFLQTLFDKGYDSRALSLLVSEEAIFLGSKIRQQEKRKS